MAKPTILLIPGACTEATCFDRLRPLLHDAGYETVAVSHPSANPTDPFAHTAETMALNVEQNYVQPLLDAGKDILVYAYSSGGSQTGTNGPSWTKLAREARGLKGGVIGIVYMSCAPVPAGTTQLDFLGGALPPFVKTDTVRPLTQPSIPHPSKQANKQGTNTSPTQPSPGLFVFDPVIPHLFNDAPPSEQAALARTALPHATGILTTPVLPPLWAERALDGRRVWLKAMLDATFPPVLAGLFIEGSGMEWEVVEREVGHCGFVAHADVVAEVVLGAAEGWETGP